MSIGSRDRWLHTPGTAVDLNRLQATDLGEHSEWVPVSSTARECEFALSRCCGARARTVVHTRMRGCVHLGRPGEGLPCGVPSNRPRVVAHADVSLPHSSPYGDPSLGPREKDEEPGLAQPTPRARLTLTVAPRYAPAPSRMTRRRGVGRVFRGRYPGPSWPRPPARLLGNTRRCAATRGARAPGPRRR